MTPKDQRPAFKVLICLALAGITFAAFAGVAHCSFITLDDRVYVVANPPVVHGFSWSSVKWALQTFHGGYWIPITWFSHMLDCQLYGINPAGHHVTNLIFHIANTVLLFLLLQKLTARLWPSAFVALLFGIHPMHVESVAWVAERKDVLSAFFFFLTLLAYAHYARSSAGEDGRSKMGDGTPEPAVRPPSSILHHPSWMFFYCLSLVFFVLGLMSKTMIVTLPFVLMLLDFWPLKRFSHSAIRIRQSAMEKLPFFVLAAIFSYVTVLAGRLVGAVKPTAEYSLADRFGHVPVSYCWYVLKLFWPTNLSVFYAWHKGTDSSFDIAGAVLLLLAVTVCAIAFIRKYPYFLFGWLWFLGMLVPVIGLVKAGDQAYADRFVYLPYIGLFIVIAWGVPDLVYALGLNRVPTVKASANPHSAIRIPQYLLWSAAAAVAIACFARTVCEVGYWKDGDTLFHRSLKEDPKNGMAWAVLGSEYEIQGENDKALDCIRRSLELDNQFNLAWEYLGYLLARKKDYAGAEKAYQTGLSLMWYKGDRIDTYNRLGDALALDAKYAEAAAAYQSSLSLEASQPEIQTKLGQAFMKNNEPDKAAPVFAAAIDLQPDDADAYVGLGMISQSSGFDSEAVSEYGKALQADPNSLIALNNLAWLLATDSDPALRNGPEAVSLAEHACQLTHYDKAFLIGTLAAAYAEAGRFDDAVAAAQKAHDGALANGERDLAERNSQLLQIYKSHKAYHAEAKKPTS
ncbi:MAG TPA: tetratricopeptide repeat protein [Verrucomicrobiae bacterium]|jgi:tetratricopeptide (TPR) repeat protein|nr:tetratricopeptide repeat protein [Verrucomicrobiae bacterium]